MGLSVSIPNHEVPQPKAGTIVVVTTTSPRCPLFPDRIQYNTMWLDLAGVVEWEAHSAENTKPCIERKTQGGGLCSGSCSARVLVMWCMHESMKVIRACMQYAVCWSHVLRVALHDVHLHCKKQMLVVVLCVECSLCLWWLGIWEMESS